MVSLFKEYKKIPNLYGSSTNMNTLSDNFNPITITKNTMTLSRKNNNIRNRENKLDISNQDNADTSLIKQNSYFTILKRGKLMSKFQTLNSLEDDKNMVSRINIKKVKSNIERYNNYYMMSDILRHKYISDLISSQSDKKINQPMRQTDERINSMIKYLNIQPDITEEKINRLSHSMTCRFDENKQKNKNKTFLKNSDKKDKINIKLSYKKPGDNFLLHSKKLSKNMFLYKKIFYYADKKIKIKPEKGIDNKLNILYSENENQYLKNLEKLNEIYRKLGKKKIYNIQLSHSQNKIKSLQDRVDFMKKVVDYTYPDMVLAKLKEQDKTIFVKSGVKLKIITSKVNMSKNKMNASKISKGLFKSFKIKKCAFKDLSV